jgi:hypothetical protein
VHPFFYGLLFQGEGKGRSYGETDRLVVVVQFDLLRNISHGGPSLHIAFSLSIKLHQYQSGKRKRAGSVEAQEQLAVSGNHRQMYAEGRALHHLSAGAD